MAAKLNVYNLGKLGVVIDKDHVHMEDGELTKAQNAIRDPLGVDGGLRKRQGLVKVNAVAAAGSITGVAQVPIAKPATRRMIVGQWTNDTTTAWNTSTNAGSSWATTNGPDGFISTATPRSPQKLWTNLANSDTRQYAFGGRPGVVYKNRFYYAGNDYTVGTSAPPVHMWDGTTDYIIAYIPDNPDDAVATASAITCMIAANGRIYLTTYDGGSYAGNTVKARIFELTPESGALVQLGSRFPISPETARVPYALAWHGGRLWTATFTGGSGATQRSYFIRPGIDTNWTNHSSGIGANGPIACMRSFQGQLFFGGMATQGIAPLIRVLSSALAYSTSLTPALNEGGGTPVMGGFGEFNGFGEMIQFGANLYVSYFNRVGSGDSGDRFARIYKYTGSAWSVVYAPAANAATSVPFCAALVYNGVLYFLSGPADNTVNNNKIVSTSDGSTWTDVSSGLSNNSSAAIGYITT